MSSISQLNVLQSLGWALVNSLWQMALLWIIYKLVLSFLTKAKASKKASLASILIIGGFGWFIFTFISTLFFSAPGGLYNNWVTILNENSQVFYLGKILSVGTAVYLILLVLPVWKFIHNYRYVQNIRSKGLSKINAEWKIFVRNTAENLGIIKKVQIWISDKVQSPVTIGFLKPIILIPVAAINQLSTVQVEAIIIHELYHIRRYDYLINLVVNFIKTVLYFNPFVKQFIKTIERERENSCDEMVIQYQYQPAEYATALLLLGENTRHQMMMAAAGKNQDLLHRVETILGLNKKTKYSFRQVAISLATLLFIAFMNVFFFANSNRESYNPLAFNSDVNPYYFLNSRSSENMDKADVVIPKSIAVINKAEDTHSSEMPDLVIIPEIKEMEIREPAASIAAYNVNYVTPVIPVLTRSEELKLKETIGSTKKILEEGEWKELEKISADVYNTYEKDRIKFEYLQEVKNADWKKLEEQLRLSYDNINWEKVDDQITSSLATIKLDSIQTQIHLALNNMVKLQSWMKENKTTSIPDSDVTLKVILESQIKAKAQLDRIHLIRNKKIIKL